ELGELIKSEEASPFPALVQLEVFGTEAGNDK
ncbi:MAG TPA: carbohydrate-binding protein, partial [Candidatus Merdenecus merdavium]|nr:carbohydrate-binding protein [Candidatus Merdenecus merdavium]